jgi:hypothetical protein
MRSLAQEMNISEQLLGRWCQRMGQVAGNFQHIFQQDSILAHNNKRTQDWLKESLTEMFEKEIWPPSSTDSYSFVWISLGVSGLRANLKPNNKTENLLPKIKEVMRSFDRNTMAKSCMSFRSRMEAVFTADSSFIEYVDCQYISLQIFFYFNKIGWFSAVLCHFKERRKKFRIYRCYPVYVVSAISPVANRLIISGRYNLIHYMFCFRYVQYEGTEKNTLRVLLQNLWRHFLLK